MNAVLDLIASLAFPIAATAGASACVACANVERRRADHARNGQADPHLWTALYYAAAGAVIAVAGGAVVVARVIQEIAGAR